MKLLRSPILRPLRRDLPRTPLTVLAVAPVVAGDATTAVVASELAHSIGRPVMQART